MDSSFSSPILSDHLYTLNIKAAGTVMAKREDVTENIFK